MKEILFAIKALAITIFILNSANIYSQTSLPKFGIIHNSLIPAEQTIMLGINPYGNLNTPDNSGTAATNSLNQNKDSKGGTLQYVNSGSVGISYYWPGAKKVGTQSTYYIQGWYDSTSQGNKWEGWGAGAYDNRNQQAWASISAHPPVGQGNATPLTTMTVKSFTVDATSVKSTVWINDTSGLPMLEVTHLYGPTVGATNKNLFQGLVTITNISGGTLKDVRYRRTMDWDVIENVFTPLVDASGIATSYGGGNYPKIWSYCDNGGEKDDDANPFSACAAFNARTLNQDYIGLNGQGTSTPAGTGSSFDFQFGDLFCNESATFYIYYGAGDSRATISTAMSTVGASMYSMGYDPNYPTLAYAFGFKGVSGTAVAPALPTKVASLPAGSSTDSNVWQTYAPPVLGDGMIYQALFKYQKDKQWIGEIKRYKLDAAGAITSDPPLLASPKLKLRAGLSGSYSGGGRSIWTVGYDPLCKNSIALINDANNNSFSLANTAALQNLLFNCPAVPDPTATNDLINFTRGLNADAEEVASLGAARSSVLGDTYHSEMVMVAAPNAPWSSDANMFGKSEAYYRYLHGYSDFVAANASRRSQLYVGSNDGMVHAFDADLEERWAFIPPSVVPMLRNTTGSKGNAANGGDGKSNSIFSVDGPITVKDVYLEGKWKTVLMGGLGWGGNSYYALDITNPDVPQHLFTVNNDVSNKVINYWDKSGTKSTFSYSANCPSFDYSKLGGAWSRPVIMLLPYNENSQSQRWVAVFGGGFAGGASVTGSGTSSSFGAYVYVVELEPDATKKTDSCGATGANIVSSTGGHVLANPVLTGDSASNIPNGVTAHLSVITGDGTSLANYYGGIAYFTDLQGQLWKLNLSKQSLSDDNITSGLFNLYKSFRSEATLANDRMGFNQVGSTIVTETVNNQSVSRLFNYFGTGDQTRIQRRVPTINNRIYGVSDSSFPAIGLSASNQTVATFTNVNTQSCSVSNSWYADVWAKTNVSSAADYQKIVGRAAVYNKYVYFTAYQPEALSCPLYGTSRLIEVTDTCQSGGAGGVIGQGLASAPTVDGKGNIYIGVSNMPPGQILPTGRDNIAKFTSGNSSSTGKVQYKSWREKRVY